MREPVRLFAALIALCALALAALACNGGGTHATKAGLLSNAQPGGIYLALGDSMAAGSGASDAARTSYVALIDTALRNVLGPDLELRSLAVGGHTTQDLINNQLEPAVEALRAGNVRLVTITISGNDLNSLQNSPDTAACLQDVTRPPCPVPEILVGTEERLDTILRRLREAGPDTPIVIEVYPNLFSGTGHRFERAAEKAFGLIDDGIARVAQRYNILIADPRAAFAGHGAELTHILDPVFDAHPNDVGYRAIGDAFLKVLGISPKDQ